MDDNTFKLWSLVISLISSLGLGIIGYFTVKANINAQADAKAAAKATADVKSTLAETTTVTRQGIDEIKAVTHKTHALVNGAAGTQMKLTWLALQRLADVTHSEDDRRLADEAHILYESHLSEARQSESYTA